LELDALVGLWAVPPAHGGHDMDVAVHMLRWRAAAEAAEVEAALLKGAAPACGTAAADVTA
jgi:hypothetical protein